MTKILSQQHKENISKTMKARGHGGKKGSKGPWTGKKRPDISGPNNYAWKGEKVGYRSLHRWIENILGKPKHCANCQNNNLNHRQYHWANISQAYHRELSDWIRLCAKCHKGYDQGKIKL